MCVYKRVLILIIAVFTVVGITALAALHSQNQGGSISSQQRDPLSFRQQGGDETQYPIVDFEAPEAPDPQLRTIRRNRGRKYNREQERVNIHIVQSAENYHWPANFPPLPTSQSTAVVIGQIADAQAYLSEDRRNVYSEFTVLTDEIIKNDNQNPILNGSTILVQREGGRVRFSTGHIGRYFTVGLGMPRVGRRYVLFLERDGQDYCILTGYELRAGRVFPLDSSGVVHFDRYSNSDQETFLDEVRATVRRNS